MPAVIGRGPKPAPFRAAPSRVALAVEPELLRRVIPARVTLDANAPPFAGELRESQHGPRLTCPIGSITVLATLRRAWNFVGFSVDPGDFNGLTPNIAVSLRTLGRSVNGVIVNQALPAVLAAGPGGQSFVGFVVGAPCELVFINESVGEGALAIHDVRGEIWGMGEK